MSKRSNQRRITRQSKILRFMRLSKNVSQARAALKVDCSEAAIGHYENGRMDVSELRLKELLYAYGYTRQEWDEYMNGRPIPNLSIKEECIQMLNKLDQNKIQTVHAVLAGFMNG